MDLLLYVILLFVNWCCDISFVVLNNINVVGRGPLCFLCRPSISYIFLLIDFILCFISLSVWCSVSLL